MTAFQSEAAPDIGLSVNCRESGLLVFFLGFELLLDLVMKLLWIQSVRVDSDCRKSKNLGDFIAFRIGLLGCGLRDRDGDEDGERDLTLSRRARVSQVHY